MKIANAVSKLSKIRIAPDGKHYRALLLSDAKKIAARCKMRLREVEIAALEEEIVPEHYQRNIGTIGLEGQSDLLSSHVAVIGAGGLGGTVLEILARFGVGLITIADFDRFEESNLNRQLLSSTLELKKKKTAAAVKRAALINPAVEVKTFAEKITARNAHKILEGTDVVADCLGGLPDRFVIEAAAKKLKVPMVHAALAGFTGQLTTIFPEDGGLKLIYGEPADLPKWGSEATLGTPPAMVLYMAALQANEVVKVLLKTGEPFRNVLLHVDLNTAQIKHLWLAKGPE